MDMSKNTRYKEVLEQLEIKIKSMKPKSKLPPIRKLMVELGVSQSPLDNALRILEKNKLIIKVRGSGIYVAPGKEKKNTGSIGLVVSNISDKFCSFVVKGIQEELAKANYNTLLCNSYRELDKELQILRSLKGKIDALIIFPYTFHAVNPEYINYFKEFSKKNDIPVVTVNSNLPGIGSGVVNFDNFHSMRKATMQMLEAKPDSRIILTSGIASETGLQRLLGIKSLLSDLGLLDKATFMNGDLRYSDFRILLDDIIKKHPSEDLIFLNSYPPALPSLLNYLSENKMKIPEQALVASIVEEDYHDYISAPIVALIKPAVELGRSTGKVVLKAISKHSNVVDSVTSQINMFVPEALKQYLPEKS
jgi:LacI family transcriptional regulator, galactose operon repressor